MRIIYQSRDYHHDQIATIYAKVDYGGDGWRVEEVNENKRTIREYITDDASLFSEDQIRTMQDRFQSRVWPSWTQIK